MWRKVNATNLLCLIFLNLEWYFYLTLTLGNIGIYRIERYPFETNINNFSSKRLELQISNMFIYPIMNDMFFLVLLMQSNVGIRRQSFNWMTLILPDTGEKSRRIIIHQEYIDIYQIDLHYHSLVWNSPHLCFSQLEYIDQYFLNISDVITSVW